VPLSTTERNKRKGKYPYYGASGIIDYIDDFIFDGEYLIISEDGENLRSRKTPIAFWATGQFWVNNHAHIVLGKENILYTDYLRLFISSNKLSGFISNSSQPKLSQGNLQKIPIPLPKDFDEKYKSTVIQKAIVEFLEYSFDNLERIRNNIDKRYEIVSKMRKSLIPSTFKRTAIKNTFKKYAQKNNIEFDITDIEFEIKRIYSTNENEVVCKKRMGFSPKKDKNDNINWFRVEDLNANTDLYISNPNTILKTTMSKIKEKNGENSSKNVSIQKGDILVSFLATPGIVKIYNSDDIAYCNQAIDILTVNEGFYNKYIAYNCILEYPKYGREQTMGKNLNDDDKVKIQIFIPKDLENYTSYEIQQIIANFIEQMDKEIDEKYFKKYNRFYEVVELLKETYLKRTFSKIVWS
jgi:restriction endonuclease S subunit